MWLGCQAWKSRKILVVGSRGVRRVEWASYSESNVSRVNSLDVDLFSYLTVVGEPIPDLAQVTHVMGVVGWHCWVFCCSSRQCLAIGIEVNREETGQALRPWLPWQVRTTKWEEHTQRDLATVGLDLAVDLFAAVRRRQAATAATRRAVQDSCRLYSSCFGFKANGEA